MAIPAYYSLIQKGSYGPDEALVQTWLNGVRDQCSYYPALTTDGRFGTRSENAVKEFQLRNSMNMDGKVGPTPGMPFTQSTPQSTGWRCPIPAS